MVEEFLRELTHDNGLFENQWPDISQRLENLYFEGLKKNNHDIENFKVKTLDALVDYILDETITNEKLVYPKQLTVERIVKACADDPMPSLTEIVRIFRRILDLPNIYNEWYLICIEAFHFKMQLCERLSSSKSIDLIELIFQSFEKHSFLNEQVNKDLQDKWKEYLSRRLFSPLSMDRNKLNHEELMLLIRHAFQQIFRHAVRLSHQSNPWSEVVSVFIRTLPNLFDNYVNLTDGQIDLLLCIQPPISTDFIFYLAKSYNHNVDLFKANFSHVLTVVERLLLMNSIRETRYFLDQSIITHIDVAVNFDDLLQMLIRVCPLINIDHRNEACKEVLSNIAYKLGRIKLSKKQAPLCFEFALVILDLCVIEAPKCVQYLLEKSEFYPWKELSPRFTDFVRLCANYDTIEVKKNFSDLDSLGDMLRLISDRAKVHLTIFKATHDQALKSILRWSGENSNKIFSRHVYRMGEAMLNLIDTRQMNADICAQFIEALKKKIKNNNEDEEIDHNMLSFFNSLASHVSNYIDMLKSLPHEVHCSLSCFLLMAISSPLRYENGNESFEHQSAEYIWFRLCSYLTNEKDIRVYEPVIKKIHSLACDDAEIKFLNCVTFKVPEVAVDYIEDFFNDAIDRKETTMLSLLNLIYIKRPEPFHNRLDDVINALFTDDLGYKIHLAQMFYLIAKEHPEQITATHIDRLFTLIESSTSASHVFYQIFSGLSYVANAKPHLFDKYRSILLRFIIEQQNISAFNCLQQYFVASTIVNGEEKANECVSILIDLLKTNTNLSNDIRGQIFNACQLIGVIHIKVLLSKREDLLTFNSYTECRTLIDLIDGKKLNEENQATINRTRETIVQMEKRVIKTDTNVKNVTKIVKRQELNITNLNVRVDVVDTRLNDVNEQVQIQAREIERIDMKTLSYVPIEWGRDVTKLMNRRADNDWRLLGKRFGYSTSELRHWAMQADPTMALLNEWFMTHKADEATYGLVKMLGEINRQDAIQIIQNAITAAGQLIPDEMPFEIKRLPPIFLSYQWGAQQAVTTLKTHLEEAGYACWMDTSQMGGGDKLFDKIDTGIRGAKVVICCMNTAYAQSDNCSREVHLTVSTGKPLIPLQMEKQTIQIIGLLTDLLNFLVKFVIMSHLIQI